MVCVAIFGAAAALLCSPGVVLGRVLRFGRDHAQSELEAYEHKN